MCTSEEKKIQIVCPRVCLSLDNTIVWKARKEMIYFFISVYIESWKNIYYLKYKNIYFFLNTAKTIRI